MSTPMPLWSPPTKRLPWSELLSRREQARSAGEIVVWTNGGFDLLHPGHIASLEQARALGHLLVVGLNSDDSVKRSKGPTRPILNENERATMLAALACVDYLVVFDETTPVTALDRLRPDIHVKGAEYAPPYGRPVPERGLVEGYGGRIEYLPLVPGVSTTAILERIRRASEAGNPL